MRTGRVTRIAEFGAFVELEPGVEGLAHASTFPPTGRSRRWSAVGAGRDDGAFEILSIDPEKKRIGVALVPEGSARALGTAATQADAQAAEELREDTAGEDAAPRKGFGSLADKLRGALTGRQK